MDDCKSTAKTRTESQHASGSASTRHPTGANGDRSCHDGVRTARARGGVVKKCVTGTPCVRVRLHSLASTRLPHGLRAEIGHGGLGHYGGASCRRARLRGAWPQSTERTTGGRRQTRGRTLVDDGVGIGVVHRVPCADGAAGGWRLGLPPGSSPMYSTMCSAAQARG